MASKFVAAFLFAITIFASGDTRAQTPQIPAPTFADVLAHYQRFNTWSATFKQQYFQAAYQQNKPAAGTMRYQWPGTIEVVTNGQAASTTSCAAPNVLMFLCGSQKAAQFTFSQLRAQALGSPSGIIFVATPIQPTPVMTKVLLYVDAATLTVQREMVMDATGNRNNFAFENVVTTP